MPGQAAVSAGVKAVSQSGLRVTIEVKSKCHGLPQQSKSRTLEQCVCFTFDKILDILFFLTRSVDLTLQGLDMQKFMNF